MTVPHIDATAADREEYRSHPGAEVEWWYQFAFLGEFTLIACFWRYRSPGLPEGLMAAWALTEIKGKRRRQRTWIDPPMLVASRAVLERDEEPDAFTQRVLIATREGRIFAPFALESRTHFESTADVPVATGSAECHLRHDIDGNRILLHIDQEGVRADLVFALDGPFLPMGQDGDFEIHGRKMSGYTFPQARVTGTLQLDGNDIEVQGKAWLDHQWGEWFQTVSSPRWTYFAIPFDDGSSLVAVLDKNNERVYMSASHAGGRVQILDRIEAVFHQQVESLRTRNLYSYRWTLDIPEVGAHLELTPFHADHEVFIFTRERGIMEMGVDVTGKWMEKDCKARGFVESFGDTIKVDQHFWSNLPSRVTPEIEGVAPRACSPEWLQRVTSQTDVSAIEHDLVNRALLDPIWSMVDRGGKNWRSSWFVLCCHALGFSGPDEHLRVLLPVVEMIHTGSLIIDDIQDQSPLRRGQPSVHRQVGEDLAINAGNFLYFLPMLVVDESPWLTDAQRLATYHQISLGMRQGHLGQALDLMWSRGRCDLSRKVAEFDATREELLEQYRLKCGCPLAGSARIAGSLSGARPELVDALAQFSESFGVVYQILDDVRDATAESAESGKAEHEDLRNGRLNMVLLHALARSEGADRDRLIHSMNHGLDPVLEECVSRAISETGALDACLALAERLLEDAEKALDLLPPTDAALKLAGVSRSLFESARERLARHG